MVKYYLGYDVAKRAYFKKAGYLLLDNDEVLYTKNVCGIEYFAVSKPPFSDFTVYESVRYSRALTGGGRNWIHCLSYLDLPLNAKCGRLNPAARRAVKFVALTGGKTDKKVAINLDGVKYSRKVARSLKILLNFLSNNDVAVLISDRRFAEDNEVNIIGLTPAKTRIPRARKAAELGEFFYVCRRLHPQKIFKFARPATQSVANEAPTKVGMKNEE